MKTAIIIPTYNETENIDELINRVFSQNIAGLTVIFVDDNSPDGTGDEIVALSRQYPIEIIKRPGKLGIGSAYVAGFKRAIAERAEYIMEMDADLSHAPEDIARLIAAAESGADLAIGSRKISGGKITGWNIWRHLTSDGAMFLARLFLGLKTRDVTAGFRCFRRTALEKIDLDNINSNGYAFQEEILFWVERLRLKIVEVPVTFTDRKLGRSKLSWHDATEFFKVMIKLKFKKN